MSRSRILALPLAAYERWYKYIMFEDTTHDKSYRIGLVFEYLWPVIFGEPDVVDALSLATKFKCELLFD